MGQKIRLGFFVLVTLGAGWLGVVADSVLVDQPEGNSLGMGIWLMLPFFVSTSRIIMVVCGCFNMVSWSIVFVELYRLTKSVWSCVILHVMQNAVPTALISLSQMFSISGKLDTLLNPEFGVCEMLIMIGVGILLRQRRLEKEKNI